MIIIGYQGIGKSTLGGKQDCIDLESGNFWVNGSRDDHWARVYCNIAEHVSNQGYTVFISSHEVVRNTIVKDIQEDRFHGRVCMIYPSEDLKPFWIAKLKKRYDLTKLEKDYKAYMNALYSFEDNIRELANCPLDRRVLTDMNYYLPDIVDSLQVERR